MAELDAAGEDRAPPPLRALRLGQRIVHADFGYRGVVFGYARTILRPQKIAGAGSVDEAEGSGASQAYRSRQRCWFETMMSRFPDSRL